MVPPMDERSFRVMSTLLATACFLSMAALRVCDTLISVLSVTFSSSLEDTSVTIYAYTIAYGVAQLVYGLISDRYGKARVVAWCCLVSAVGNLACALSQTLTALIMFRILTGASTAGIFALSMAWIGDNVDFRSRQVILARLVAAGVMGMLAGQWLSGLIADYLNWRYAFMALTLPFFVCGVLLRARAKYSESNDGLEQEGGYRRLLKVLWTPLVLWTLLFALVEGALGYGALAFVPNYLQHRFSLSLSTAGGIAASYAVGGYIYTKLVPIILKRMSAAGLARLGAVSLLVGYNGIALTGNPWVAGVFCALSGFGFYCLHNTLQTHASQMVAEYRGLALSAFACALFIGQSVGVSIAALIYSPSRDAVIYNISGIGLLLLGLLIGTLLRFRERIQGAPVAP